MKKLQELLLTAVLVGVGVNTIRMEKIMADFSALNAKLDEQDAARGAALQRITEDVQALQAQIADLQLDAADQAEVDAVVSRLQQNIDALNAIDPVRADEEGAPADGGGEAPAEEPADGGEAPADENA